MSVSFGYNSPVTELVRVASPPTKATLIFDGECGFCRVWIERWRAMTGDSVEYIPFQDARVFAEFPEIPRENFEQAVQLIEPGGRVYSGAEAVARSLAYARNGRWLFWSYQALPGFAGCAEGIYRFVAAHRLLFSALTRLLWGAEVRPPSYRLMRWTFLRGLGLIYFVAFVSLWAQMDALVGSNGILPAKEMMQSLREQGGDSLGTLERFRLVPTFGWLSTSDAFLQFQCGAGAALAILLMIGIAPIPCLSLSWLFYLSLAATCQIFLGYQWDNLLLEVGFIAIFFAPLRWRPGLKREAEPSRVMLWLIRWLLFRLMFASGCVKLLSGDAMWHNLTALTVHYETQPLPTWVGWYAHQMPAWSQKASCGAMFFVELVVPFLIFLPRRPRMAGAWLMILFQIAIALAGNYCFFNLLSIVLCLSLFDDAALLKAVPRRWVNRLQHTLEPSFGLRPLTHPTTVLRRLRTLCVALVATIIILITAMQTIGMFRARAAWPSWMVTLYQVVAPFRSVNSYGLFAVMTPSRPEIIVEGSNDGQTWLPYEFKYKPGDLERRPAFVAPHQPRLDWQMWFAALGDVRGNRWFINFAVRLLQGTPETLALLEKNPFPNQPPKFVRGSLYDYRFTDGAMRRATGRWWRREYKSEYCPAISLRMDR